MLEEAIKNTKGEGSVEVQPPESRVDKRTPAERAFQKAREKRVSFVQYSKCTKIIILHKYQRIRDLYIRTSVL